jgi:outer membrane autotransporter protein
VSGSSNFALSYAAQDTDFGQSELGLKAGRTVAIGDSAMALELSAAWAHQLYGAPFALAAFQALPGSSFTVQGGRIATDTALLGAGLDWRESDALSLGARVDSQLGGGTTAIGGTGTISLRW